MKFLYFPLLIICFSNTFAQNLSQYNTEILDSLYKAESNPPQKLSYAYELLERSKKEFGTSDTSYAKNLNKVGNAFLDIDLDSSIFYFKKAIEIQKVKAPKKIDYANTLNNLGIAYYYLRDLKSAEKYWLQSTPLRREILGETHRSYLGSLINLGNLYMDLGYYQKASQNYMQAKNIFETQNMITHEFYTNCLVNLGLLHEYMKDYEKSEAFYQQALEIQKTNLGEKHPTYIVTLGYLSSIYKLMGEYEKSENFLLQVLKLKKEMLGEGHFSYTETLVSLGNLYLTTGDYEKAEIYYLQDMELVKKINGTKNMNYAKSLGYLGGLYRHTKNYEKAENYLTQAMNLDKEILGAKHPTYASTVNNLADLYIDLKQYSKAEILYLQSYTIRKEILHKNHNDIIWNLNDLAEVYCMMNQLDLAWQYVLLAIQSNSNLTMSKNVNAAWIDSLKNANFVSLGIMDYSLSIVYLLLEKQNTENSKQQQILIGDLALELLKRERNNLDAESDKLRILGKNDKWVLRSMRVLDKNKEMAKALSLAEQNKSVLLLDAVGAKQVHDSGILPDAVVQEEKDLQNEYAKLKAALAEKRPDSQHDSIRTVFMELNFKIDNFQKKIKTDYPKYAEIKFQQEAIQAKEIQAKLGDDATMLEYLIGDSVVYIFCIDKNNVKIVESLIDNKELKDKTRALHNSLSDYTILNNRDLAYRKYTENAHWFYKKLIEPVMQNQGQNSALSSSKKTTQLIIVTDGELGHLPFETFLVEPAPQTTTDYKKLHYLINDYRISYNYSATLFVDAMTKKKNKNKSGQILGIAANYGFLPDTSKSFFRIPADLRARGSLAPLPAARAEVESLQEKFQGFFAFDKEASEKTFKEKSSDFSIIHLALHGLLNKQEQSLSSLAFTEDGDSLENNFLHAYEISMMELNADLVVLSACETGFGKFERGNGIASLARSFMYAGVPAMVVSLWQVNDHSTSYIMQSLYNHLASGMPKDAALQEAKLEYMEAAVDIAAHPAFWSPFILIGNTEPTAISTKGGLMPWLVGGGLLVLLLGGFVIGRRKV